MLRPGQAIWLRMAVVAALAYGGSFVVRGVTAALQNAAAFMQGEADAARVDLAAGRPAGRFAADPQAREARAD